MKNRKGWQPAVDQFWADVKELLLQKYRRQDWEAQQGVTEYQEEVARRKLGDVVYNQGEEQTASVIDGMIRDGRLPLPTAS